VNEYRVTHFIDIIHVIYLPVTFICKYVTKAIRSSTLTLFLNAPRCVVGNFTLVSNYGHSTYTWNFRSPGHMRMMWWHGTDRKCKWPWDM